MSIETRAPLNFERREHLLLMLGYGDIERVFTAYKNDEWIFLLGILNKIEKLTEAEYDDDGNPKTKYDNNGFPLTKDDLEDLEKLRAIFVKKMPPEFTQPRVTYNLTKP